MGDLVAPIVILSPPRSFSSVVSSMLGQHPQLRSTAETGLLHCDTVAQWLERYEGQYQYGLGAQRTIADILYGVLDAESMAEAGRFLRSREGWTTAELYTELMAAAAPDVLVDKSPLFLTPRSALDRVTDHLPGARFLHLTRHPYESVRSMMRWLPVWRPAEVDDAPLLAPLVWQTAHRMAQRFLDERPAHTWARVRGEDAVNDPVATLGPVLGAWGLRTDHEALSAMLHPERSPHAQHVEFGGNGRDFLASPELRGTPDPPERLLPEGALSSPALSRSIAALAQHFGYRVG